MHLYFRKEQFVAKDKTYNKIILGIDPGTTISGYGVIGINKSEISLIAMGIIDLRKEENQAMKLQKIYSQCSKLVEHYLPDELAIEAPFYGKNPQSMLKLGRAQGVAMSAALNRQIPIFEYAPKRVKQSVTGNGNASKEQVAGMVKSLLNLETMPSHHDATDAIAIAICHHFMYNPKFGQVQDRVSGWSSYLKQNPDRLK
jgi:crossover junction endodeoxyribonuclease RuvC